MKEPVEFFDRDFLDNKIEIGDKVIFEAPGYRHFVIGTVLTKAPKSCQVEYINDWNYEGVKEVTRQGYGQIIKYPIKEGTWIHSTKGFNRPSDFECSLCGSPSGVTHFYGFQKYRYCPDCGAKMEDIKT